MKKILNLGIIIFMLIVLAIPIKSNAATYYTGESYFTYNEYLVIQRNKDARESKIQEIPANSRLYVWGKYTKTSKHSDSRSWVQYNGKNGHVRDEGFRGKYLPHERNYSTRQVNKTIELKDDKGNIVTTISAGTKVEIYGDYTLVDNALVIRYKDYYGWIPSSCFGSSYYAGESYFTYTQYNVIQRDRSEDEKEIQTIPAGSFIYVYGKYTKTSKNSDSRSWVQYNGKNGHVRDEGFSGKILPHERNYSLAQTKCDVTLKDDAGKSVVKISKGKSIEVYGVYTKDKNESVVRYGGYRGHIATKNIVFATGNINDSNNSSNPNLGNKPLPDVSVGSINSLETLKDFKLKNDDMFVALTTANLLSFQTTKEIEFREIPKNSMIVIYGVWANNTSRYVAYWDGNWGTVNSQYITKLYNIEKGFDFTPEVFWGTADYALNMWNQDDAWDGKSEIPAGKLVLVLGKYESKKASESSSYNTQKRYLCIYEGECSTVVREFVTPMAKSVITSLSHQKTFLVENGKNSYTTDCVTGKPSTPTEVGTYDIYEKVRDTNLSDNETYYLEIDYWAAIYREVGFHDNSTRSKFGLVVPPNQRSHGCINLPDEAAAKLYNFVSARTNTKAGTRVDIIDWE